MRQAICSTAAVDEDLTIPDWRLSAVTETGGAVTEAGGAVTEAELPAMLTTLAARLVVLPIAFCVPGGSTIRTQPEPAFVVPTRGDNCEMTRAEALPPTLEPLGDATLPIDIMCPSGMPAGRACDDGLCSEGYEVDPAGDAING
jgi:hypothetical protein